MHGVAPSKPHQQAVPCELHRAMPGTAQQHVLIGVATAVITAPPPAKCLSAVTNPSLGCCSVELQVLLHALSSCCATSSCGLDSMAAAATAQQLLLQLLLYDRNRAQMLCSVQQRTTSTTRGLCKLALHDLQSILPRYKNNRHTHNNVTTLTSMHETLTWHRQPLHAYPGSGCSPASHPPCALVWPSQQAAAATAAAGAAAVAQRL